MEQKRDNGILKGLLLGVAVTLCVIAVLVLTLNAKVMIGDDDQETKSPSDGIAVSSEAETSSAVSEEVLEKLEELEALVDTYFLFETDEQALKEGIYKGYMSALDDPYSCYYNPEEYKALQESTSGKYSGIGVSVSQNIETGIITAVRPFPNCPGAEAGLRPGDIFVEVAGIEVTGMDLNTVVSYIKGEEGTTVHIKVYRESDEEYYEFDVERRQIEIPTVEHEMLKDQIGYIQITEFDSVTFKQFKEALTDLESQGMKGLIIDVRNNPGGLLNIVVNILDTILPKGSKIVYTEDKNGQGDTYYATTEETLKVPLTVLMNGNSASASEIFAGAIKDHEAGTLVGTTTFGKGIVQHIMSLDDGESAIKITVSRYFTPSGVCIHEIGVDPDVEIDLDEELKTEIEIPHEDDNQLQKAIEVLKEKIQ